MAGFAQSSTDEVYTQLDIGFHYDRLAEAISDLRQEVSPTRAVAMMAPLRNWIEMRDLVHKTLQQHAQDTARFSSVRATGFRRELLKAQLGYCVLTPVGLRIQEMEIMDPMIAWGPLHRRVTPTPASSERPPASDRRFREWLGDSIITYSVQHQKGRRECVLMQINRILTVELLANAFQALHTGVTPPPPRATKEPDATAKKVLESMLIAKVGGHPPEGDEDGRPVGGVTHAHVAAMSIGQQIIDSFSDLWGPGGTLRK